MKSFNEWLDQRDHLDEIAMAYGTGQPNKASKEEVVQYWKNLLPTKAIYMAPVMANHKGSTYSQDGIRITGSREFIDGVLARIKDIVAQETGETKLEVSYRQIDSQKQINDRPNTFVFYCMVKQRGLDKERIKVGDPSKQNHLEINKIPQIKPAKPPTLPT